MNAFLTRLRRASGKLRTLLVAGLSSVALVLSVIPAVPRTIAAIVLLVAVAAVVSRLGKRMLRPGLGALGAFGAARVILAATAAALAARVGEPWPGPVAGAVVALAVTVEPALARAWRQTTRFVTGLPGTPAVPLGARLVPWHVHVTLGVVVILAASPWLPPASGVVALVAAVTMLATTGLSTLVTPRLRAARTRGILDAYAAYDPEVMVYFTGPRGTQYQLKAWSSVLDQIDARIVVVVREQALARAAAATTDLPVVAAPSLADLDALQRPGLRVALYVNNGAKNAHNVRYRDVTHVQLLHGDSDKPASFNPVTAMFDKIFVAGQAGIDRYAAHGVHIPAEKFEIVGRPQVVGIDRPEILGEVRDALYAPTWTGFQADANYGSLPVGTTIVRALLDAGLTVTFRPHPYSRGLAESSRQISEIEAMLAADAAATGRAHVFGQDASSTMTLTDCFNACQLLVTDVSSVPADFLFSEKPFVIVKMQTGPVDAFLTEFPLARAAYLAQADVPGSLAAAVADATGTDTLAATRRELRTYYLGDLPYDGYEMAFLDGVGQLVADGRAAAEAGHHGAAHPALPAEAATGREEAPTPEESLD
ncbi:CDP-glycerol glycerophosphotransferase family protein [Sanguibacter sp. HDW7]|uniref:CDP-glycerol glycerophosphotransferase family protein n=1 Tax=Sanguibacter sp. HDW7 TaxID=2714931 RepID=UPI00140A6C42|nr:CDP-glycerol glycerophosphotransferase family protein [Sanguibacter sp. HDW7]QIK82862.1 CDP-glycerol glycerophosphotransferase [Sanguibacter sp. HDW7]